MFRRLKWAMFGAAGLLLAAFALVEDETARSSLASAFGLAAGLGMAAMARAGVDEGEIQGRSHVRREEQPGLFWFVVGFYTVFGLGVAVVALYSLLF